MRKSDLERGFEEYHSSLKDGMCWDDLEQENSYKEEFVLGAMWALKLAESEALDLIEHTRIACLNFKYGLKVEDEKELV